MPKKRKGMSKTSPSALVKTLFEKAFQESEKKSFNFDQSVQLIDSRLGFMVEAIGVIHEKTISKYIKKEAADQCWNIVLDYFNLNDNHAGRATWDTDERLEKLRLMTSYCEESYPDLDDENTKVLTLWKQIIAEKLADRSQLSQAKKEEIKPILPPSSKKAKTITPSKSMVVLLKGISKTIMSKSELDISDTRSFLKYLSNIDETKKDRVLEDVFNVYKHILKLKYKQHPFADSYKKIIAEMQNFLIGEIPEEKQQAEFNRLVEVLKKGESESKEKIDLNITLPTEAMLLHPSHVNIQHKKSCVNGDSSRRLVHGLKGMENVIGKKGLNYQLVTVSDPKSAEKIGVEEKTEEDVKNSADKPLSIAELHQVSKELQMPLTGDMNGDILVNTSTLQAVMDSAELARKSILQSKKNGAPSIAVLRPPGHHASEVEIRELSDITKAQGFCFINNVFVGAKTAANHDAKNILVIDFDTHDGNGTKNLLSKNWSKETKSNIYFVNTYSHQLYPHAGEKPKKFTNWRSLQGKVTIFDRPFPSGTPASDAKVIEVIEDCFKAIKSKNIDTVLISCGLDAHKDDPLGQGEGTGIALSDSFYSKMIAKVQEYFPNASLSIYLEGGYNVKVIERTFENILKYFENQKRLKSQSSVLPYSIFPAKSDDTDVVKVDPKHTP